MNYKQSGYPNLGLESIKMDYFKVGQGLGLERGIMYEQRWSLLKNESKTTQI